MGIRSAIAKAFRSAPAALAWSNEPPPYWLIGETPVPASTSGVNVTPNSAMRFSAVLACVRILAESVASLPLHVYERLEGGGKRRANELPEYRILHDSPNDLMTSFIFRETLMSHACRWGNAFGYLEQDGAGRTLGILPLAPDRTQAHMLDGRKVITTTIAGKPVTLPHSRVLHVFLLSADGINGVTPLQYIKQAVGLGMGAEESGARLFGNGFRMGGFLKHPKTLSDNARKHLKESFIGEHAGLSNSHKLALLEEGLDFVAGTVNPDDAQYLETRKFQITEIARAYRVPPHMLADLEKATFSNIEQQGMEFVVHTLRPWLVRWEQEINAKMFPRGDYFAEFNVDGLLRGDATARSNFYRAMWGMGVLNPDEIREMENMNPQPGGQGKVYRVPLNTADPLKETDKELDNPQTKVPDARQK
jgi:HK97 family phage portal protein